MTTGAAQVMTSVELEVEATSGKDVGEITNEQLESVHAGACAAPGGLGADLERRKRGIELLSELLRRRAREKLSCVREDQRIWRDDLKKRSRQRQRLAKKERMAQQQLKLGNPPGGHGVELGTKNRPCNRKVGWSVQEEIPEETGKEWRKYEQDKCRKVLLTFGAGEWNRIQGCLLEEHKQLVHGVNDIRNLTYTFLVALRENQEKQQEAKAPKKEGGGGGRQPVQSKEDAFLARKIAEFESEGAKRILDLTNEWPKIDKLGLSWLRKLRLLDLIRDAALMGRDEERRQEFDDAMATISESSPPVDWWSIAADKALLLGVYKHGYGSFDKIREDPEYASAFTPDERNIEENLRKKEQFRHKPGCNCVSCAHTRNKKRKAEAEGGNAGGPPGEGEEGNGAENGGGAEDDARVGWPSVDTLTKRLKRMVEVFARQLRKMENKSAQKTHNDRRSSEWTKKDRFTLAQCGMRWGLVHDEGPAQPDWAAMRDLSGLTKKSEEQIEACFLGLVEEAEHILQNAKRKGGGGEGEGEGDGEDGGGKREDAILTPITAARLFDRIELMDLLKQMAADAAWDWQINRSLQGLPSWWDQLEHDRMLVNGVLKHGAGKWEDIWLELKEEGAPVAEEGESHGENFQEDKVPTILQKRLKQVTGTYQRRKAEMDKRVLVGELTTREVVKEEEGRRRQQVSGLGRGGVKRKGGSGGARRPKRRKGPAGGDGLVEAAADALRVLEGEDGP